MKSKKHINKKLILLIMVFGFFTVNGQNCIECTDNYALGLKSTALGLNSTASGDYSFSVGRDNSSIGNYSFSMGYFIPERIILYCYCN